MYLTKFYLQSDRQDYASHDFPVNYTTSTLNNYLVFVTGAAFRVYPLIITWILLLGVIAS